MTNITGPILPRGPIPSGIGKDFTIGVTPVGTQPSFDVWETVISQYANSPILTSIILNMFSYIDQTKNMDDFFDLIWNIDTAQGYGLDVWGRIVGINRSVKIVNNKWLGFAEMGSLDADPFNQSVFYNGEFLFGTYQLVDNSYRNMILIKAAANITDGSIPAINAMLMTLFPNRGNAYVKEGTDFKYFGFMEEGNAYGFNQEPFYNGDPLPYMRMTYVFEFPLTPDEMSIVSMSNVLPKPTGVLVNIVTR